jgi:hypothetical protein
MFLEGFLKNIWSLRAFLRLDEDAEQVILFIGLIQKYVLIG